MGLYEGLFGKKNLFGQRNEHPDHFQVRPFIQQSPDDGPSSQLPLINLPSDNSSITHDAPLPCDNSMGGAPSINQNSVVDPGRGQIRKSQQAHQVATAPSVPPVWQEQYDRSLGNIQDHIHAIAGAVAMLDAVEHKFIAIKCELQRIRDAGLSIDGDKVLVALQALSDYVNDAVTSVDDQCVNMLRDSQLEIRIAGAGTSADQPQGVALTMISLERLLDFKVQSALSQGMVAEETPEFINDICTIVSSNIQTLTSIMLALFASRDYTQAVTRLAAREGIIPSIGAQPNEQISSATIDRFQIEQLDQQVGNGSSHLQAGRASLNELLKKVSDSRDQTSAQIG
jgi:hypothetical protein